MMPLCEKCISLIGVLFLIVGVLFLLKDIGVWNFWNLNWWTVGFLLFGIGHLGMRACPACQDLRKK